MYHITKRIGHKADISLLTVTDESGTKYRAEKLFVTRQPTGRVAKDIISDLRKQIMTEDQVINHPYYLYYQDLAVIEGEYYLIREEVDLTPLATYLATKEVDFTLASSWLQNLAEIYTQLNQTEVAWSGLCLESLWVGPNDQLYLVQPSITQQIMQYRAKTKFSCGNKWLQPPEMIGDKSSSEASQVYSLAALLYYLLTSQPLFDTTDKAELVAKIKHLTPLESRVLNSDIAPTLNELIMDCLRKDSEERLDLANLSSEIENLREQKQLVATPDEITANQEVKERAKQIFRVKEKSFWFVYRYWHIGLGSLVAISLLVVSLVFMGGQTPVIKSDTPPKQVVNYFYQALDNKNITLLEETVTQEEIDSLEGLVLQSNVVEKMRQAYSGNQPKENKIYTIRNLKFEQVGNKPNPKFKASYQFVFNRPQGDQVRSSLVDYLTLKQIGQKWKVVKVEGDIFQEDFLPQSKEK